jgi:hypothetical protein
MSMDLGFRTKTKSQFFLSIAKLKRMRLHGATSNIYLYGRSRQFLLLYLININKALKALENRIIPILCLKLKKSFKFLLIFIKILV